MGIHDVNGYNGYNGKTEIIYKNDEFCNNFLEDVNEKVKATTKLLKENNEKIIIIIKKVTKNPK